MTWDGAGNFGRVHNFSADASAGIQAQATRFDAEFDGIATGLENCVTRSGENAATANLPMGGFRHTGTGAAQAQTDYARMSDVIEQTGIYMKGEGSSNAGGIVELSVSAAIWSTSATPNDGAHIIVKTDEAATQDPTPAIKINAGTAYIFTDAGGRELSRNYFTSATLVNAVYDASADHFKVLSPPTGYDTVSTVLNGISSAAGQVGTGDVVDVNYLRDSLITVGKCNSTASVSISASADHMRMFMGSTVYAASPMHIGQGLIDDNGAIKHVQIWSYDSDVRFVPVDGAQISGPAVKLLPFTFSYINTEI